MKNEFDNVTGQPVSASCPELVKTGQASTTPILAQNNPDDRAEILAKIYLYLLSDAWGNTGRRQDSNNLENKGKGQPRVPLEHKGRQNGTSPDGDQGGGEEMTNDNPIVQQNPRLATINPGSTAPQALNSI